MVPVNLYYHAPTLTCGDGEAVLYPSLDIVLATAYYSPKPAKDLQELQHAGPECVERG